MRARILSALVGAVAVILVPQAAAAHADLTGSDPADGARLRLPPAEVTLTFSEPMKPASTRVFLTVDGEALGRLEAGAGGDPAAVVVAVPLDRLPVTAGPVAWTVRYDVVSRDGHEVGGEVGFRAPGAAAPPSADPTPAPAASATGPGDASTAEAGAGDPGDPRAVGDDGSSGTAVVVCVVAGVLVLTAGGLLLARRRRAG